MDQNQLQIPKNGGAPVSAGAPSSGLNLPPGVKPVIAKDGTQLNPYAVAMAKAVREHESGGNYQAKGKSGEYGAYQFTEPTWKNLAGKYLGNPNSDLTPENQDKAAYGAADDAMRRGLTPQEFAAEWNSGSAKGWENKRGVNSYGVKYDVPAYVNAVYSNYQKYKPVPGADTGTGGGTGAPQAIQDAREQLKAAGQPVSVNEERAAPTFLGSVIRGIAKPFANTFQNIKGIGKSFSGKSMDEINQELTTYNPYLGVIHPVGTSGNFGKDLKESIGTGLDIGSNFVGFEGAGSVVGQGLKGLIKEGAITGLKSGAAAGATQGLGQSLENNETFGQTLLGTGAGALIGGATGGVLGGATSIGSHFAGTAANRLFGYAPKVNAAEYESAVKGLGDKYRTVFNQTAIQGEKELAQGKDAAYHAATLAAEGKALPFGADSKGNLITTGAQTVLTDKVIKPENELLEKLLTSENKALSIDQIQRDVESTVLKEFSGVKREQAQRRVQAEFNAYRKQYGNKLIEMGDGTKGLKLEDINKIKRDFWKNAKTKFNATDTEKLNADVNYQIGSTLRQMIEDNVQDFSVKELNRRLGDHQNLLNVLQKRNARPVGMGPAKELLYRLGGSALGSKLLPGGFGGEMIGYFTGGRLARLLENPNIDTFTARNILKQYGIRDPKIIREVEKIIQARGEAAKARPQLTSGKGSSPTTYVSPSGIAGQDIAKVTGEEKALLQELKDSAGPSVSNRSNSKPQPLPKTSKAKAQLYEPYTPTEELPVIKMGNKPKPKEKGKTRLPTIR